MTRILIVMAMLVVAACGAVSSSLVSSPSPGQLSSSNLVQSAYPNCNRGGETVAHYLNTGEPKTLDPIHGNERQQVLALSGEQRALAIRQVADQYISQCAKQEAQAEAAAAAAKAQAEAEAAAARAKAEAEAERQAHQQKFDQNAPANCSRVGAAWKSGVCSIGYRASDGQIYYFTVGFDRDGNIIAGVVKAAAECSGYYGPGLSGIWHPDTMICSL